MLAPRSWLVRAAFAEGVRILGVPPQAISSEDFLAIVEKLMEWFFECAGKLFHRFDRGTANPYSMEEM
jgi:hypothetical protein